MLHRKVKEGAIHAHSNPVKPYLTEEKMRTCVVFCLNINVIHQKIHDMMDDMNIDEKCYYQFEMDRKYYLGENQSLIRQQSQISS
jgi:hypothetical protein